MTGRVCIRGCKDRGEHFAACPDFGKKGEATCLGCVPAEARHGILLCDRCYSHLRRNLEAAPDVLAVIRSTADPLKAAVYDRELVSGSSSDAAPAPVAADLIDAGDSIVRILSRHSGGRGWRGIAPGEASDVAHARALRMAGRILGELDALANDSTWVVELCAEVIDMPPTEHADAWTIERAARRWPLADRSFWAAQPCPFEPCGLRAIKVTPPRTAGGAARYHCQACNWTRHDYDTDGPWFELFSRKAAA